MFFASNKDSKLTGLLRGIVAAGVFFGSATTVRAHCPTFGGGIGIAGPVTTFSAATLPAGKAAVGLRVEISEFGTLPSADLDQAAMDGKTAHSMREQQFYSVGGAYGVTDDLTVGASLPYVLRDGIQAVHFDPAMQMSMRHDIGRSDGLGDLTLFGEYRLVRRLYEGFELSLIGGLKAPTGATGNSSAGATIATLHQPGSGSWDPLGGIALSQQLDRLSLHATGLYVLATRGAQATNLGDRAQGTLAGAYRFGGKDNYGDCDEVYEYFYPESRQRWLGDLVLELNANWQDKETVAGRRDDSSGGVTLFLSPGGRLTYDGKYSASVSVGVPVYQDLNGSQSKTDYRVIASVAVAF
ncbi:hypothetical protein [Geomesophilobacter sediminis]|uniref:Transporter n=1 Tax=Geomesophilobacter sediminis TaxID=2798584 RepID=A0A8J7M3P1_9BACT|nr:hypothetical protein [Geomesophilobacter sediminis]MBJ6727989.1 hypothetical protein [Geomesophilobacter sediminis]